MRQAVAGFVVFFCGLTTAFGETKVLRNFNLIDGTGKSAAPRMAMIVVDGRISSVGTNASIKAPSGAEEIDLSGKFVMPGLINCHGHVGSTVDLAQGPQLYSKENVEKQLAVYASYGVTTVLSLGTDLDSIFEVRAAERAERPQMARVYTAGEGFVGKGGFGSGSGLRFEVETPEDVAKDVDKLADEKVDIVKMWVDDNLGKGKKLPIDLARAIIQDAHQHHLRTAAHIFYLADAQQLVDSGIDALAHSVRDQPVDRRLIDAMKKRGVWLSSATLTREVSTYIYAESPKFLDDPFFTRSVSAKVVDTLKSPQYGARIKADPDFTKYHSFLTMAQQNLKRLSDAGVRVGFGTDTGPPARFQGYFEHWEMELMVDAGLTPSQVIQDATKNAAEFLGARDLGTLEKGKWADLIVLSKNPLEDIRNTRTIEAVYIAGNHIH